LRGSSRVVPGYWGVRPVRHQLGTPIIPKSSVRRASHPKGCDDLRKAELGSRCIRTRDKDTREAVVERAVGQAAGPVSNRNDIHQPSGTPPGLRRTIRRSADLPKRHERAVGQAAGPVSNGNDIRKPSGTPPGMRRTIRRSAASELSGKTPGPSRSEPSAEAPQASRRARRRARLDPNHPPKRYTSEPSGKPPGPSRSMRRRASRRAHRAVHRAIRRASCCRGAACDPALKPQPAGPADIEPNPLDYSL